MLATLSRYRDLYKHIGLKVKSTLSSTQTDHDVQDVILRVQLYLSYKYPRRSQWSVTTLFFNQNFLAKQRW